MRAADSQWRATRNGSVSKLPEAEDQAVFQAGADMRLVLSLNSLAVLALGIVPGWLWALCLQVFRTA